MFQFIYFSIISLHFIGTVITVAQQCDYKQHISRLIIINDHGELLDSQSLCQPGIPTALAGETHNKTQPKTTQQSRPTGFPARAAADTPSPTRRDNPSLEWCVPKCTLQGLGYAAVLQQTGPAACSVEQPVNVRPLVDLLLSQGCIVGLK